MIRVLAVIGMLGLNAAYAVDEIMPMEHHRDMSMTDTRISLNLSGKMKRHQLADMRDHLAAINDIVGLMAGNRYAEAAEVAHDRLGLTPQMQKMCNMLGNEKATELGLAFHRSGDDLADALKTQDVGKSLSALNKTIQYCVACHAMFRQ